MSQPSESTPKLNRRQQAKALTRQKLIDAGRACFEAEGYAGTKIRDLAKDIDMSTGALFSNFTDKEALWSACFGCPVPDLAAADEMARIAGQFPTAGWVLSYDGAGGFALNLLTESGGAHTADANSAAAVLRLARLAAESAAAVPADVTAPAMGIAA